jgi:hypothetical protein
LSRRRPAISSTTADAFYLNYNFYMLYKLRDVKYIKTLDKKEIDFLLSFYYL